MPSIRELVVAVSQRAGVDGVIVLGQDGRLIDGQVAGGGDIDELAATVPGVISAARQLGRACAQHEPTTVIVEFDRALAFVSVLSQDAVLLVLLDRRANVGDMIAELRQNRAHMVALV
jgi:predicted regulator of Ras-like GTPase activity (Roadblock/LC7/MglB family)